MGVILTEQRELPFRTFEEELIDPLLGHELTEVEKHVASLLLEATSEKPIRMAEVIIDVLKDLNEELSDRDVRHVIRSLRRDHAFPICSRKGKPAGYWWGRTEAELKEFIEVWQAQYLDEIRTLYIMTKVNFPRLAGQLRFKDLLPEEDSNGQV